ncbi:hypothetical protein QBC37DRAFT_292866 [Rhypophila decipiens]|uniref:Uncharacterized protein n=1 Tax=Rhypophila decipiens TaxID=261697 RepID=A0AAN6Y0B9_9PEZI|nr:hypothetical protein QBC37DRAFT_292866 [Rhypophila decipiens]
MQSTYAIQDQYVDPVPPTDAWATFLAARFSQRPSLYENFPGPEKELVRKELRRVRYLREYFAAHRLSPGDTLPLASSLEKAHKIWRDGAIRCCKDSLASIERELPKADFRVRRPLLLRNRTILRQVEQWQSNGYLDLQKAMSPGTYVSGLEAADDSVDDDPRKSDYGYNGWVMVFEEGKGGVTLDHPDCHGKFPHQKIAMQKLLYDKQNTPLRRAAVGDGGDCKQLRYFHLQANNMKWVEDAVARYYGEDGGELGRNRSLLGKRRLPYHTGGSGAGKKESKTERLLKRELWHCQERGGVDTHLPPHSRQIRPRCALVPSPEGRDVDAANVSHPGNQQQSGGFFRSASSPQDVVLFMPYLHWEIEKRLVRMTNVTRKTRQNKEREFAFERRNKRRGTWGSVVEQATKRAKRIDSTATDPDNDTPRNEDSPSWRPRSPLGSYLWLASKLYQLIDEAADWRLIGDHLYTESPLHIRRTLEQYYYWTAEDTTQRDRQQVVYRGTWMHNDPEAIPRVVMVDQLWLYILDENTIISAFPRRWGRNKPDPSAVHRAIRDHLGAIDTRSQIKSIYDLALVIIDECSRVFFDRTKPDLRPEMVDIYSSAISKIAEKKTEAYERFGRDVKRMNALDPLQTAEELLRKSLNIKYEWSVLMEAQNVIDQLQIMQEIFTQQIVVMGDFERALRGILAASSVAEESSRFKSTVERAAALITEMKLRRDELANLEKRQANTRSQLRELLDMKQQQSGIIEAKAAIRRADESVLQGRSIVVFTVVTIFFLPLSFFAAVFGMNTRELNDGYMTLNTQLLYMFVLSSIVISISLALAFSSWARTVLFGGFRLSYAFIGHRIATLTAGRGGGNGGRNTGGKTVKGKHLHGASSKALREFMLAKQREWEESKENGYYGASSGLPFHRRASGTGPKNERRRSSGGWTSGQFSVSSVRFWRRPSRPEEEEIEG